MNTVQQGILALLKSAITDEAVALPEQFDIEQAYPIMRRHSVLAMGYAGALKCGISKDCPAMQRLRQDYFSAVVRSEGQMAAIRAIQKAFHQAGIDYMLLKGSNLKLLYPAHEYRAMGDADILIRVEQYDKIRPLMLQLGYTELKESDHELVWNSKALHLELHKRLVPSNESDYFGYYGDGWAKAVKQRDSQYAMTPEDEYIYLFTHLAKHYRGAGVGLRQVLDLWIYAHSHPQMDRKYIRKELQKLGLLEFYDNACKVIDGWFSGVQMDAKAEHITRVIFDNGNWGDSKNENLSSMVRQRQESEGAKKSKLRRIVQKTFPPFAFMRYKYPVLQSCPILLPVFWVVRLADLAFFHRERAMRSYKQIAGMTDQEIESFEQSLEYVGLRFEK